MDSATRVVLRKLMNATYAENQAIGSMNVLMLIKKVALQ
jgi:hypothetical protein